VKHPDDIAGFVDLNGGPLCRRVHTKKKKKKKGKGEEKGSRKQGREGWQAEAKHIWRMRPLLIRTLSEKRRKKGRKKKKGKRGGHKRVHPDDCVHVADHDSQNRKFRF